MAAEKEAQINWSILNDLMELEAWEVASVVTELVSSLHFYPPNIWLEGCS